MALVRYHVKVTGRVQGVCYRFFCQEMAEALSLTGWVRNLPDGSVEMEVQGKKPYIESLSKKLNEGPPLARTIDVQKNEIPVIDKEDSFMILY
jgi:acylphosphatase